MKLKKPKIYQVVLGALILAFQKNSISNLPPKIGKYKLVKNTPRNHSKGNILTGTYEFDNKFYFVKHWTGKIKDLSYYALVNEYFITIFLQDKLDGVRLPKIIDFIYSAQSFSVVFEYIEGKTLDNYPVNYQVEVINHILSSLNKLSKNLTYKEKKQFTTRPLGYYIFFLPIFSVMIALVRPSSFKIVKKALIECFRARKKFSEANLTIAHRDLTPNNILISPSGQICLLDCESVVLTLPGYDKAYLSVFAAQKELTKQLDLNFPGYNFLKNYILIHHILGSGKFLTFQDNLLEVLYQSNV